MSLSIKFKQDECLSRRLSTSSSASVASSSCTNNHSDSGHADDFGLEMRKSLCPMTELSSMSMPRCGFGVGVIGEEIFVAGWSDGCLVGWVVGRMVVWLGGWLVRWVVGFLDGRVFVVVFVEWLVGRLAVCLDGWLVVWMVMFGFSRLDVCV